MNIPTPEQYLKQLLTDGKSAFIAKEMQRFEELEEDLIRFKRARVKQELEHKGRI